MKQGRMFLPLVLSALLLASLSTVTRVDAGTRKAGSVAAPAKRAGATLHQFSGVVTALDKGSLTVEKSGRTARSMVFARHAEMKTTGDLEKDARVTVWYREEGGHAVAHKVVVKGATLAAER